MKILILEDSPSRMTHFNTWLKNENITHATSVLEALDAITNDVFDFVFLDYELGYGQPSGGVFTTKWQLQSAKYATQNPTCVLHTSSDVGASQMKNALHAIASNIVRLPFYNMNEANVQQIIALKRK